MTAEQATAADRIVDVLVEADTRYLFGLPGGATMEIYKALHGREAEIRPIVARDEQTASCMADMHGKMTGRPGVFAAQGGFAGSIGMFGVIEAYLASSPMVVLTELSDFGEFAVHGPIQSGTGQYGSIDLAQIFKGATKFTSVCNTPREAVISTQLALKHAVTGRPGPAACLFRTTSLKGRLDPHGLPEIHDTHTLMTPAPTVPPDQLIEKAAGMIAGAGSPVIIAGNGARISRAFDELRTLAQLLGAPVVTSTLGKSAIAETHPLAAGPIGYTGQPLANETVGKADVLIVVGCRLKPQETCYEHPRMIDPKRQRIVQIDIEPRNASWTFPATAALVGDARLTLQLLIAALERSPRAWDAAVRTKALAAEKLARQYFASPATRATAVPIHPQRFVGEVAAAVPDDAIICSDAGNNRHWMNHYFQTRRANCYYGTGGLAGVSWSLPAALTAKLLAPDRPAIGVCSDGGFAMQMHVLLTAVQYDLAPIYVVMNNAAFGMTLQGMGNRATGSEFPDVDFAAIARASGAFGVRATRPGEIAEGISAALKQGKPAVIDVVIDKGQDMRTAVYSPWASEALAGNARR